MLRELDAVSPSPGQILTADALHTQVVQRKWPGGAESRARAHREGNRENLYAALEALCSPQRRPARHQGQGPRPQEDPPATSSSTPRRDRGPDPARTAGRQGPPVRAVQYWKGNGSTWKLVTKTTRETVYLVASLTAREAGAGAHRRLSPVALGRREPGPLGA